MSQAGTIGIPGGISALLLTLTGNSGGAVGPTGNNINVIGTGVITVVGNPGTSTLTITPSGSIASSFATDSGTATPALGVITFNAVSQAGATVLFSGSGSTVRLNVTDANNNTIIGRNAGNAAMVTTNENCGYGVDSLLSLAGSDQNHAFGVATLKSLTTGVGNNIAIGNGTLQFLVTGNSNTCIGSANGSSYTGSESSNILIGRNINGTLGENNVLRIGVSTGTSTSQLNKCFIQGITSQTIASNAASVLIDTSTGQLGIGNGSIVSWTVVTGASQTIAVNNGYISNRAGLISYSLPATSAVGDIFEITNINTALGWTITQAAGQQIRVGNATTTLGAGGSLSSLALGDSVRCVCVTANTIWVAISAMGNLTLV